MRISAFTFVAFIFIATRAAAQPVPTSSGTDFWIAYMENLPFSSNGAPRFAIVISAVEPTVISIENQAFSINASLDSGETREFLLDSDLLLYLEGSDKKGEFGIRVRSDQPVQVWARHYRVYFSESTLVIPVSGLGSEYIVMAYLDDFSAASALESSIVTVAVEDNTVLEIIPSVLVKGSPGYGGGTPYTVTLDKGEVYQIQSEEDLSGTRIRAVNNQKIAVFSGAQFTLAGFCNATSRLYDQQYPVSDWGKSFALLPLIGEDGDFFRVLTSEDFTRFTSGCNSYLIEQAGTQFTFFSKTAAFLSADKPVAVGQITRGAGCDFNTVSGGNVRSDPSFLMLSPLNQTTRRITYARPQQFGLFGLKPPAYIQMVFPSASAGAVRVNDSALAPDIVFPLPGNSALSYCLLPVEADFTEITGEDGIWAIAFTVDEFETMSEHLGFDLLSDLPEPPGSNLPATLDLLPQDTICQFDQFTFSIPQGVVYQKARWDFGNGTVTTATGGITSYDASGSYLVQLTLWSADCTDTVTYSQTLQVLSCPIPPFEGPQITVDGDCLGKQIRISYFLPNGGTINIPRQDYTFVLNIYYLDKLDFFYQFGIQYTDAWGRDTVYNLQILQRHCYDDFTGDYIRATGNCAGEPVRFDYINTYGDVNGSNPVVSHRWDFGESNLFRDTSRSANPTYIFEKPGHYNVRVQARKYWGDTATISLTLNIVDCPEINPENPGTDTSAQSDCNWRLFPNPFIDNPALLSMASVQVDDLPVEIFDLAGRLVYSQRLAISGLVSGPLSLSDLPSGMYILRWWCAASGEWIVRKAIKIEK